MLIFIVNFNNWRYILSFLIEKKGASQEASQGREAAPGREASQGREATPGRKASQRQKAKGDATTTAGFREINVCW